MPVAVSDKVAIDKDTVEVKEDGKKIEVKTEDDGKKVEVKITSEGFSYNDALVILFYVVAIIACISYSDNFLLSLFFIAGIVASVLLLDPFKSGMVTGGVVLLIVILYYIQNMFMTSVQSFV